MFPTAAISWNLKKGKEGVAVNVTQGDGGKDRQVRVITWWSRWMKKPWRISGEDHARGRDHGEAEGLESHF